MKMYLKLHEFYFLLGLLFYTIGQFLIFIFFDVGEWRNQEPIDFTHWFMLIGVLLLIPQIGNFPKSKLNLIGIPLLVIGIVLNINEYEYQSNYVSPSDFSILPSIRIFSGSSTPSLTAIKKPTD